MTPTPVSLSPALLTFLRATMASKFTRFYDGEKTPEQIRKLVDDKLKELAKQPEAAVALMLLKDLKTEDFAGSRPH